MHPRSHPGLVGVPCAPFIPQQCVNRESDSTRARSPPSPLLPSPPSPVSRACRRQVALLRGRIRLRDGAHGQACDGGRQDQEHALGLLVPRAAAHPSRLLEAALRGALHRTKAGPTLCQKGGWVYVGGRREGRGTLHAQSRLSMGTDCIEQPCALHISGNGSLAKNIPKGQLAALEAAPAAPKRRPCWGHRFLTPPSFPLAEWLTDAACSAGGEACATTGDP